MTSTSFRFRGSWAAVPIAWNEQFEFDEPTYRGDIARLGALGVPGVYTGGTTGEFYALEFDEFRAVTRATVEAAHAVGIPAMIGVTSTYTRGAERRAAFAAKCGADAIQLALPFWMEVPNDQVVPFFRAVSTACGHLPLSVYETGRCKKLLTLDQHRAIKDAVPNYGMVKANANTVGLTPEGCATLTALGVSVFAEEGSHWPRLSQHGVAGCCSSFVYYAPQLVLPMNAALAAGNQAELERLAPPLVHLLDYIVAEFVRGKGYWDTAMDRLGGISSGVLRTSLRSRPPYPHATETDVAQLRTWMQANLPGAAGTPPSSG